MLPLLGTEPPSPNRGFVRESHSGLPPQIALSCPPLIYHILTYTPLHNIVRSLDTEVIITISLYV